MREFLTTNPVEGTTMKLQALGEVIRDMSASGEQQDASTRLTRGETGRQRSLRDALWSQHMVPLSRIARRVFGVPGMDPELRLPPKRADNDAILASARGMAQAAEKHVDVLVNQEGLPADFLEKFHSAIEVLASAVGVRVQSQNSTKTSREALEKLMKRGIATVEILDAIVKPRLQDRPELLAAWDSVKRPLEVGGGTNGAPSAPAPAAAPVVQDVTPVVKAA